MPDNRPFAVFDIDGTVARTSLYLATVHAMKRRGMLPAADAKLIDVMLEKWLTRDSDSSFEQYSEVCIRIFEKALPTVKLDAYKSITDEVIEKFSRRIYRYTTELIKALKQKNYMIFAVSGSEHSIVERFCREYGFDDWTGNDYEHDGKYFTGVTGTTYRDKTRYVREMAAEHGCTMKGSIAIGDTHGDIEMLEFAEKPIAFNPNKTLYEYALASDWAIVVERKNVIYKLRARDGDYRLEKPKSSRTLIP